MSARDDALGFGWTLSVGVGGGDGAVRQSRWRRRCWPSPIFFYVGVYTLWLKRRTPQNIVIGGLAGALPPAIGWAAVTGSLSPGAAGAGRDHLPVDAAAFLGAGAVALRRLRARRRADAAGRQGQAAYALADPALYAGAGAAGLAPAFIGFGGPLYLAAAAGIGAMVPGGSHRHLPRERRRSRSRRRTGCSAFRCSICSRCSPR